MSNQLHFFLQFSNLLLCMKQLLANSGGFGDINCMILVLPGGGYGTN
jgi:hypothetical protein